MRSGYRRPPVNNTKYYARAQTREEKKKISGYFLFGMKTRQRGTMPRHEANQAAPAVSALHTHFDVSRRMRLNAKCPGQKLSR